MKIEQMYKLPPEKPKLSKLKDDLDSVLETMSSKYYILVDGKDYITLDYSLDGYLSIFKDDEYHYLKMSASIPQVCSDYLVTAWQSMYSTVSFVSAVCFVDEQFVADQLKRVDSIPEHSIRIFHYEKSSN